MRRDQLPFLPSDPDHSGHQTSTREQTVTVLGDFDTALAEITVHGRWNPGPKTTVAAVPCTCLASRPAGIIVDLHDLTDPAGTAPPHRKPRSPERHG
ncbi:hypothetical protein ODJ79_25350 [Actinoplanes sp. KI2]|uniref:hypothetical protein n=1 Tax=Actinoplanes sp. KI2 TaxID=2983315 RepID=UPI0021D5846E|nr:hypothetical protein [Actinoplanes sp. KI2]MCU7727067.1 hypothetical protein [Actinoplanes sp. KI2]